RSERLGRADVPVTTPRAVNSTAIATIGQRRALIGQITHAQPDAGLGGEFVVDIGVDGLAAVDFPWIGRGAQQIGLNEAVDELTGDTRTPRTLAPRQAG